MISEATFCRANCQCHVMALSQMQRRRGAYEICKMYVTIRVQENIVRLNITMYNALTMYISQGAAQLGDPKPYGLFCESLSGYVET